MTRGRSSLPVELGLTAGLILSAVAIVLSLFRPVETIACTLAVVVLAANAIRYAETGTGSWLQVGLSLSIVGLAVLTLPELGVPGNLRFGSYVALVVAGIALTGLRYRARSRGADSALGFYPALEFAFVVPSIWLLLWLPFYNPDRLPDGYGYIPNVMFVLSLVAGLIAILTLLVSFVARGLNNQRMTELLEGLVGAIAAIGWGYLLWTAYSPHGTTRADRLSLFGEWPVLVALVTASYLVVRVRGVVNDPHPT